MKQITREFSRTFTDRNWGFITQERSEGRTSRVGFLLLENFSLPCFTQALDVLVTANLICPGAVHVHTFSHNHIEVMSDLGIPIRPDTPLTDLRLSSLDLIVICGGLRAARTLPNWLSSLLKKYQSFQSLLAACGTALGILVLPDCLMAIDAPYMLSNVLLWLSARHTPSSPKNLWNSTETE
ncbi:hypothetical protein QFA96_16320 [Pseudomonas sp. Ap32]|nr:hypothetical protein QFA96_16320 [Pseudomonas sp. Ap32]